ncbi:MAG: hypothetical protein Q8O76_13205, partial [Chloroflexota bacterium]|nr:hypothetical protein [Chloroflexota bacterium]
GVGVGHRGIGALPVIIVIAIALGILALFGALTFKLVKSSWKEIGSGVAAGLGPLLLIGGGLFIAYQALAKKGIVPQRNPEKRGGNGMLVGAAVVGVGLLLMASKGSGKDGDGRNGDDGGGIPIPPPPVTPAISKFNVRWS